MRRIKKLGLAVLMMSASACAPVVYDATYRAPSERAVVRTVYTQPRYRHKPAYQQVQPIEVTLYADNAYAGSYFKPIHIIIADGQYVEIPTRDRRGRSTKFYAHYQEKNLHFDANKACQGIPGSTRYKYNNGWNKGQKYSHINIGKDFDLTGLRLQIRSAPVKVVNKVVDARQSLKDPKTKRPVTVPSTRNKTNNVGVHQADKSVVRYETKSSRNEVKDRKGSGHNKLNAQDKTIKTKPAKTNENSKRPHIVEKLAPFNHAQHAASNSENSSFRKQVVVSEPPRQQLKADVPQKMSSLNGGHKPETTKEIKDNKRPTVKKQHVLSQLKRNSERKITKKPGPDSLLATSDRVVVKTSGNVGPTRGTVTADDKQGKWREKRVTLKDGK